MRSALTLGRLALLEARRTGIPSLLIVSLLAGFGLAGFLSQLAVTEGVKLQAGILAAFFRLCAVFLTAVFVVTSMVREGGDKGTELLLSLPLSRTAYYLGKLGGFTACGSTLALSYALVMLIWSPPASVAAWLLTLAAEVALMAAASLFFVVTLSQIVPALAATAGLYLLGRTIGAIQSISASPLTSQDDLFQRLASWGIDGVALLLPPLDKATQTVWLLYGPPSGDDLLRVTAQLVLYSVIAVAAGLFDFHRRNL